MSASLPGTSDSLALFNNSVLLQSLSCNFSSISVQLQDRHVTALLIVFVSLSVLLTQYLGHVEVDESRGMHICEDAVKRLKTVSFILSYFHPSILPRTLLLNSRLPPSFFYVLSYITFLDSSSFSWWCLFNYPQGFCASSVVYLQMAAVRQVHVPGKVKVFTHLDPEETS